MPMQIDVYTLIITVLFVLITLFLIPALLHLKATLQRFDEFLREAQRDVYPMLKELRKASENLNQILQKVDKGAENASTLLESVGEVGESIHKIHDVVHHGIGRYAGNAVGLWLGMRAASKVFLKQLKQQKGGE